MGGYSGTEQYSPMADILPFKHPAKKKPARGLCQHGHHKWKLWMGKQFDVKAGKLVTVWRCERCGKEKVKAL